MCSIRNLCSIQNVTSIGNACTTRTLLGLVATASLVLSTGCQTVQTIPTPDKLAATPIPVDGAMAQRNWPQTSATYESFTTEARPTGFWWTQRYDDNGHYNGRFGERAEKSVAVSDYGIYFANLVTLPIALIVTPPWTKVESSGGSIPPTYTAAYPLTPIR